MIRCIAIDDEPLALRQISSYIEKVPYLELVAACPSAVQASRVLEQESVDVLFVDINMPDLSGMDFVRSLADPPMVVFTTAYSEYAVEGFKVDAVDYLLKPFVSRLSTPSPPLRAASLTMPCFSRPTTRWSGCRWTA